MFLWRLLIQNYVKPFINEKRKITAIYLNWNSVRLKFVKKTSMQNPARSLGYIKCYSSSSPTPVKSPRKSIRCNCLKICSWSRRPKTILEIRKRPYFSRLSTILLFTSFSNTLLTTERRLIRWEFLTADLPPTFLNTATTNDIFQQILKNSASIWKLWSTILKNHLGNTIRTSRLEWIKVHYDLF